MNVFPKAAMHISLLQHDVIHTREFLGNPPAELTGDSNVAPYLVAEIIPFIVCTLVVIARVYARVHIIKKWSWDDTLIIAAWLSTFTVVVMLSLLVRYGETHHMANIPLDMIRNLFDIAQGTLAPYQLSLCFSKLSILFLYLRLFTVGLTRILAWITVAAVVITGTVLTVLFVFACDPVTGKSELNHSIKCIDPCAAAIATAVFHTVIDGWLIILVLPSIIPMNLPLLQKIGLLFVFSLGLLTMAGTIVRLVVTLLEIADEDITWNVIFYASWTSAEMEVSIICASAPTLPALYRHFFGKGRESSNSGDGLVVEKTGVVGSSNGKTGSLDTHTPAGNDSQTGICEHLEGKPMRWGSWSG